MVASHAGFLFSESIISELRKRGLFEQCGSEFKICVSKGKLQDLPYLVANVSGCYMRSKRHTYAVAEGGQAKPVLSVYIERKQMRGWGRRETAMRESR